MWATYEETLERFRSETHPTFDFRVYDEWDNGEFLTGATVDLIERGKVVRTEKFVASLEEPGMESAYWSGSSNHAVTQALSFAWGWVEARQTPLEDALAPFGSEWVREMEERNAWVA